MADVKPDIREIFNNAAEMRCSAEVSRYLDDVCSGDARLRAEVQTLLRNHDESGNFLGGGRSQAERDIDQSNSAYVGTVIGPYKLRELLGEGGMGSVYVAEQEHPVRRKVALKVIKPGMDSRQVLSRFDAERQALELMDHPHIAKVLDAGTTDTGRPYFVMELVKGVPITEFCDARRLAPRERLSLFIQVCRAIQHAHQKGIIHRDIKPSNILVTLHDDLAVPVVIDFGIAKATGPQLTEQTVYTAFNQLIGTPLYMSPEQAEMNALDVDTRSDVYSLGVLLYELLTGSTPFASDTLREAGFDEMRRMIREVDPPRPSQRLSTLAAEAASTVSQSRGVDQRHLHRALRGDLDLIVMKALEKDRTLRYESASALAADVQRHLDGEPIQAKQPRLFVGVRKWCRRHRTATTATAVAAILLLMFATGIAADRRRLTQDTNHFVELSLQAARTALESGNVDEAARRMGEAQIRIDAVQLVDPTLGNEVAALKSESERYAKFLRLFRRARNHPTDQGVVIPSARKALALYQVMDPEWFKSLQKRGFPEAHTKRVGEAVYELLLQNADQLIRWSNHWPKATREARLQEQCHEAMDLLEKAIAFHAPSRGYYWLMANCSLILGDKEKEKRLRVTAMETPPHHAAELMYISLDHNWGTVSENRGYPVYTFDEIFKDHLAMLRLDPTYHLALHMLAFRLGNEGRVSESLLLSYGLVAVAPTDYTAILNRGICHGLLGHYDEAKADYETVLTNCPDNARLLQTIAYNLATFSDDKMRDGKRAVAIAQKMCKLTNYENDALVDALACAYAETGDFKSAVKWSEMAVGLSVNHLREEYVKHLESFRQGKPWREENQSIGR